MDYSAQVPSSMFQSCGAISHCNGTGYNHGVFPSNSTRSVADLAPPTLIPVTQSRSLSSPSFAGGSARSDDLNVDDLRFDNIDTYSTPKQRGRPHSATNSACVRTSRRPPSAQSVTVASPIFSHRQYVQWAVTEPNTRIEDERSLRYRVPVAHQDFVSAVGAGITPTGSQIHSYSRETQDPALISIQRSLREDRERSLRLQTEHEELQRRVNQTYEKLSLFLDRDSVRTLRDKAVALEHELALYTDDALRDRRLRELQKERSAQAAKLADFQREMVRVTRVLAKMRAEHSAVRQEIAQIEAELGRPLTPPRSASAGLAPDTVESLMKTLPSTAVTYTRSQSIPTHRVRCLPPLPKPLPLTRPSPQPPPPAPVQAPATPPPVPPIDVSALTISPIGVTMRPEPGSPLPMMNSSRGLTPRHYSIASGRSQAMRNASVRDVLELTSTVSRSMASLVEAENQEYEALTARSARSIPLPEPGSASSRSASRRSSTASPAPGPETLL